jgi:glycosyltransferase involved in cell wall biosynthesis
MGLVSIVVPVKSRVNRLVLHTRQLESLAQEVANHDFEFIFVDDGSNEESIKILEERASNDKRYRVVTLTRDFGPAALFLAGITYASGDCVGFFSDPNIDPSKIFQELIHHWESGSLIVLGKWKDPYMEPLVSRRPLQKEIAYVRNLVSNRFFFQEISSLIIDKQVMYVLPQVTEGYGDIVDLLAWTGYQARLVEYTIEAQKGEGKRLSFQDREISLKDTNGVYLLMRFKISISLGLILTILGALSSLAIILAKEYSQPVISDWWVLGSAFVFILGVQLCLMGFYGYHLWQTFVKVRGRQVFVVDSVINPPISDSLEGREKIDKMILSLESIRKQRIAYAASVRSTSTEEDIQD